MDETGHSGDTGAAESGTGADSHDRALLNGHATPDSPWSKSRSVLDPDDVPAWRRPSTEIRPFAQRSFPAERPHLPPGHPSGEIPHFGDAPRSGDADRSDDGRPFGESGRPSDPRPRSGVPLPSWSNGRPRYADLLASLSPDRDQPADPHGAGPHAAGPHGADPHGAGLPGGSELRPGPSHPGLPPPDPSRPGLPPPDPLHPGPSRADTLQADDARRVGELRAAEPPTPASAPPYPYEGDLDDARRAGARPPVALQRAAVPLERPRPVFPAVRPAAPGERRADWPAGEPARHALDPTPAEGLPRVDEKHRSQDQGRAHASYDPSSFPRRLPYDPAPPVGSAPPADSSAGYATPGAFPGFSGRSADDPGGRSGEQTPGALPQRVPAEPDVPTVPELPSVEPSAETPALARIATHLRRGDLVPAQERQEGFDVNAILAAVREVDGVRDASLRTTPAGAHSLRLDLADGADPAEVSRQVARLLQDRMGLDAAMQGGAPSASAAIPTQGGPAAPPQPPGFVRSPGPPPAPMTAAPFVPAQQVPPGRPSGGGAASASAWPDPAASAAPAAPTVSASAAVSAPPVSRGGPPPGSASSASGGTAETVQPDADCGPPRPLQVGERPGPRVMIENVQVNTFGTEATVEVRLAVGGRTAVGVATGPGVDGYLLRMCAMATTKAVDDLLSTSDHADGPAKCFVEHAASVPFGPMQVAVVVLLLSCGGWVEQLAGSAVVTGDERDAMVRATLAAVNRRLEALLS